jgi:hypothetical protein
MLEVDYEFQSKRRVATVAYGGSSQDEEVAELRKTLHQQFDKDGFFLQNDAKEYYTEKGLGMGVYDWRPKFIKANEVGIELENWSNKRIQTVLPTVVSKVLIQWNSEP